MIIQLAHKAAGIEDTKLAIKAVISRFIVSKSALVEIEKEVVEALAAKMAKEFVIKFKGRIASGEDIASDAKAYSLILHALTPAQLEKLLTTAFELGKQDGKS